MTDPMTDPRELTIYRAAELMRRGELTAETLTTSCLARIGDRDPDIRAWVMVATDEALEQARHQDRAAREQRWQGPLHGIPFGIKDIIDVKGWPTRGGSEAYDPITPDIDAAPVELLRRAGAVFLGKTVTTAMAYLDPPPTRNPWNHSHTPGGSSSGSAAGVADRMCLAALGTQTGGSVMRPAAYNGIVGFKPTYGAIGLEGVLPAAWEFDTLGTFTRSVEDARLLWHLLRRDRTVDWQTRRDKLPQALVPRAPRRIWRMRDFFEEQAEMPCTAAINELCARLTARGVEIVERPLPPSFESIHDSHLTIMSAEIAAYNRPQFESRPEGFPPKLSEVIRQGLQVRASDYVAARFHRERFQVAMTALLSDVDAALMPSAPGPAPRDLTQTGSANFNAPWSLCGVPSLSLPIRLDINGLPVAAQFIANFHQEDSLLAHGAWIEHLINFVDQPP